MKLAISGKGGVGKTTLAALLAWLYAQEGRSVLAIDADPDANLGSALGIERSVLDRIVPIAEMKDLIEERTGARPGSSGGFFRLNPRVDDIPERFSAEKDGVRLLVMGTVKQGGGGCICPESVLLKSLVRHLLIGRRDVVILDMEAGIEHLGRGTAGAVDAFIVVVEPGRRSLQTAEAIKRLASDIGIPRCYVVGSKVRDESDRLFIAENLPGFEILGHISFDPAIVEADLKGLAVYESAPRAVVEARAIKKKLDSLADEVKVGSQTLKGI